MQREEDSKDVDEEQEEGLAKAVDKLFVITMVKLDILRATVQTPHFHLVNIADNLIM